MAGVRVGARFRFRVRTRIGVGFMVKYDINGLGLLVSPCVQPVSVSFH